MQAIKDFMGVGLFIQGLARTFVGTSSASWSSSSAAAAPASSASVTQQGDVIAGGTTQGMCSSTSESSNSRKVRNSAFSKLLTDKADADDGGPHNSGGSNRTSTNCWVLRILALTCHH
jgi:hypothetical protein